MGVIQEQSIKSSVFIMAGFVLGAFNILVVAPKVLTPEQLGLTRVIADSGVTLATLCTFGTIPIIYKFFPFYTSYLPPRKNDLPFISMMICLTGFIVMCVTGYFFRDLIIQKFSGRSPLFVEYSYLVYPFCLCMLAFIWLEAFGWSLKKGVFANAFKETIPRLWFTLLVLLLAFRVIGLGPFLVLFSLSYLLPALSLLRILQRSGQFHITSQFSSLTRRLKGKMTNFGLFLFGAQFLNLLSKTVDTFIITAKAERGLADTAVFTLATYVVAVMEVPQRSLNSITVPVLAESWKNKDMNNIRNIYSKSVTNLLIIGLIIFLLTLLNVHNLAIFLGQDYAQIEVVTFFLGVGKLIDLGTGANGHIISTSNYWRIDFTTNVVYTLLALPLNYILISRWGLLGAAYSTLISLTFFNLMRYIFLWYQFGLQPYKIRHLILLVLAAVSFYAAYIIPRFHSVVIDTVIRTAAFSILFLPAIYFTRIAPDLNQLAIKYAGRIRRFFESP